MGGTQAEIERAFRSSLKNKKCLSCGIEITDAAIDWGDAQPRKYDKDGPFPLKCELCDTIQYYDVFDDLLRLEADSK
jgi:hypothetical protein